MDSEDLAVRARAATIAANVDRMQRSVDALPEGMEDVMGKGNPLVGLDHIAAAAALNESRKRREAEQDLNENSWHFLASKGVQFPHGVSLDRTADVIRHCMIKCAFSVIYFKRSIRRFFRGTKMIQRFMRIARGRKRERLDRIFNFWCQKEGEVRGEMKIRVQKWKQANPSQDIATTNPILWRDYMQCRVPASLKHRTIEDVYTAKRDKWARDFRAWKVTRQKLAVLGKREWELMQDSGGRVTSEIERVQMRRKQLMHLPEPKFRVTAVSLMELLLRAMEIEDRELLEHRNFYEPETSGEEFPKISVIKRMNEQAAKMDQLSQAPGIMSRSLRRSDSDSMTGSMRVPNLFSQTSSFRFSFRPGRRTGSCSEIASATSESDSVPAAAAQAAEAAKRAGLDMDCLVGEPESLQNTSIDAEFKVAMGKKLCPPAAGRSVASAMRGRGRMPSLFRPRTASSGRRRQCVKCNIRHTLAEGHSGKDRPATAGSRRTRSPSPTGTPAQTGPGEQKAEPKPPPPVVRPASALGRKAGRSSPQPPSHVLSSLLEKTAAEANPNHSAEDPSDDLLVNITLPPPPPTRFHLHAHPLVGGGVEGDLPNTRVSTSPSSAFYCPPGQGLSHKRIARIVTKRPTSAIAVSINRQAPQAEPDKKSKGEKETKGREGKDADRAATAAKPPLPGATNKQEESIAALLANLSGHKDGAKMEFTRAKMSRPMKVDRWHSRGLLPRGENGDVQWGEGGTVVANMRRKRRMKGKLAITDEDWRSARPSGAAEVLGGLHQHQLNIMETEIGVNREDAERIVSEYSVRNQSWKDVRIVPYKLEVA